MKNLLTVAAAAIAIALTGCKYENSNHEFAYPQLAWTETVSGSETVRTTNTWGDVDGNPRIVASVQTKNGATVYSDSGFKYESTITGSPTEFTRTVALPAPATELHKNTYSDNKDIQLTAEIYRDGETTPSGWMRRELDGSGRITREESLYDGVRTVLSNYDYGYSGYTIKYDSAVTTGDATVTTRVQELYNNNERTQLAQREVFSGEKLVVVELWGGNGSYLKYVGENITVSAGGDLNGETLVVEQSAQSVDDLGTAFTVLYTTKEFDPATGTQLKQSSHRAHYEIHYMKL